MFVVRDRHRYLLLNFWCGLSRPIVVRGPDIYCYSSPCVSRRLALQVTTPLISSFGHCLSGQVPRLMAHMQNANIRPWGGSLIVSKDGLQRFSPTPKCNEETSCNNDRNCSIALKKCRRHLSISDQDMCSAHRPQTVPPPSTLPSTRTVMCIRYQISERA